MHDLWINKKQRYSPETRENLLPEKRELNATLSDERPPVCHSIECKKTGIEGVESMSEILLEFQESGRK